MKDSSVLNSKRAKRVLILGRGKSGEAAAKALREGGAEVDFVEGYDEVVVSPGVPVKSELQYGCEELRRRGWKLLAVTGSKGKSSVVKMCAEALGGTACGNYGLPVSALIDERPGWAVVEISSFQLETTTLPADTFEAAAILNLQEDHLTRHGSKEVYHALKRKLLSFTRHPIEPFGETTAARELYRGSYFDNGVLRANAESAVALLKAAGLKDEKIAGAFREFRPLSHRFELVAELGGVKFVDDSKATSIAALIAGIGMCSGVVRLIAGGLSKGDDPALAGVVLTGRVKKVYIIGSCADCFYRAWSGFTECEICGTLEAAVEKVKREAATGETVLLSPGTASFDQFKSFEERGEVFAQLVKKEK